MNNWSSAAAIQFTEHLIQAWKMIAYLPTYLHTFVRDVKTAKYMNYFYWLWQGKSFDSQQVWEIKISAPILRHFTILFYV